ncbi:MAG: ATPase, T2SS/T4P/T4SS family [Rhodobacteraceae bacterium]|nr:ATPase, T2SS/T4P/T4SS family [Paracoccaceae bacterium]
MTDLQSWHSTPTYGAHVSAASDGPRLREIGFSDIYISTDPRAPILAQNVTGVDVAPAALSRAPLALPDRFRSDSLKLLAAVEAKWAAERFLPEFSIEFDDVDYRCSQIAAPQITAAEPRESARSNKERNWCLRRIDKSHLSVKSLGMPTWCSEELVRLGASSGLVLVAGAFSSGKSTTSAACLREWVDVHGGVAVTIEDPPEKALAGFYAGGQIYQLDVRNGAFADVIRASRRWAFRYMLLGEVRDQTSADELLQISLGGPMVITTIHASGPVEALMALSRFASSNGEADSVNDRIAATILGVLWQSINNGRLEVQYLSFRGRNAASMRTKVSDGRFRLLREDLHYQSNLRNLGRISESF